MNTSLLLPVSLAMTLALASCDKSRQADPVADAGESAGDFAAARGLIEEERMAVERERLAMERTALEEEKEALRAEREARLAAREQDGELEGIDLEQRQRQLAEREAELGGREEDLAARESTLSGRELELAGRGALEGWEPEPLPAMAEPVADYDVFYEDLQEHGSWYETPDYGYVYQPAVVQRDTSWRPYTRGRWACTNLGWNWISDEPFGWACFHYGRWALLGGRGWVWVPGDEWAPSWVCWREGNEHVGWAPLPPETLCDRGRGWDSGVEAEFGIGAPGFTFVQRRHMADPVWKHCLPVAGNPRCIEQTDNITNIRFVRQRIIAGGPAYDRLRREVGKPWPVYQIRTDRVEALRGLTGRGPAVRGNQIAVFAPNLNTRWNPRLKPSRVAGRWDGVEVVRADGGIKRQWTERFRDARVKQQEDAATWSRAHAGDSDRRDHLEANRSKVGEAQRKLLEKQREMTAARIGRQRVLREATRDPGPPAPAVAAAPADGRGKPVADEAAGRMADRAPTLAERQRRAADQLRETRARRTAAPASGARPPAINEGTGEVADGKRGDLPAREAEATAKPDAAGRDGVESLPPGDLKKEVESTTRTAAAELEDVRRRRQEAARETAERERRHQEETRRGMEEAARVREDQDARQRQEQDDKLQQQEQARLQMEDRARQMREEREAEQKLLREQQVERARQQEEELMRQREQARLQQEELARQQEQARQQQEELMRQRELARQQQEQARQQQDELARQRQEQGRQQQQEEVARQREQTRQRQEEAARQREQARQQQEETQRRQLEERSRGQGQQERKRGR